MDDEQYSIFSLNLFRIYNDPTAKVKLPEQGKIIMKFRNTKNMYHTVGEIRHGNYRHQ